MFLFNTKNLSLILLAVLLAAGCKSSAAQQKQERQNEPPQEAGSASPAEGANFAATRPGIENRSEFTVVFSKTDAIELDFRKSYIASEAQIFTAIYEGLFSYHPLTLEPVPAAAERWQLSDDKKQWTFTIRQDAKFSNGDPLTAENFRASWLSLIEPERESPYSSLFDVIEGVRDYRSGAESNPEKVGISAEDEKTLVVKLNTPVSFFPAMLCHHSFSPIHASLVNKDSWTQSDATHPGAPLPVSNGPFFISSMDDEKIILLKSENYWDTRWDIFKKITVRFSQNAEEASGLWNSGKARWIAGDVNTSILTDRSGIKVNPMFATHYYYIRGEDKPWSDHRVRRAMALVLPWNEIRSGYALPAKTLVFPISGYPRIEGFSAADYEEAAVLMSEAGYANGEGMPELVIRLTPSAEAARVGSLMAAAWKDNLGLKVRVEVIPYNRYFQTMKESGYIVGSSTWIGDFADPYTFLQMWRRGSNLNDAMHNDPDYEALIEKSMLEEGDERLKTLAEAEKLLLDRGAVLPIAYSPAVNIIDTNELDGWYLNALDIHPFKYLTYKAFRPLPGVALAK